MIRLKQVEQARTAIVTAASDTRNLIVAALAVAVLSLIIAVAAVVIAVRLPRDA